MVPRRTVFLGLTVASLWTIVVSGLYLAGRLAPLTVLGLLGQGLACLVILAIAGIGVFHRIGPWFLAMAFLYHGITEITQALFPNRNMYRDFVTPELIDAWMPIISGAMILYAVAYVVGTYAVSGTRLPSGRRGSRLGLGWQAFGVGAALAYAVTVSGLDEQRLGYTLYGLSRTLLPFLAVLASTTLALKLGPRSVWTIMVVQAAALSLTGARWAVFSATALTFLLFARSSDRLPRARTLVPVLLCIALMFLTISGARDSVGRDKLTGKLHNRIEGLASGIMSVFDFGAGRDDSNSDILHDVVYRFDGNSFGALISSRLRAGWPPAGLAPIMSNVNLVVPRFLNTSKLDSDLTLRNEEAYMVQHYGLKSTVDYLPTTLGIVFGYYGIGGLLIGSILLGLGFAVVDTWLSASASILSGMVSLALLYAILYYEQGVQVYFLTFRSLVALWLGISVLARVKQGLIAVAGELHAERRHAGRA